MKKIILSVFAFSLLMFAFSCKKEAKTAPASTGSDSLNTTMSKDTAAMPKKDSASVVSEASGNSITKNTGKYPNEIKLFEDKSITDRLKKLTGTQYDEMIKNFNVESPIVAENGIYKVNGCKQHDCPGYATSIYYDSKNDNFNVRIDKNGKMTEFAEKGKITVTDVLKSK